MTIVTTFASLWAETLGTLNGWVRAMFAMLPNMVLAIAVVFAAWGLSRLTARLAQRASGRLENQQLAGLLVTMMRLVTLGVGLFVALSVLELEKTVTSLVAGLGVVGLTLGFAFQDIASNFMSGLLMAIQRPFRTGDFIEVGGHSGVVQQMDLRTTILLRTDGIHAMVPNSKVYSDTILNYTREAPRRIEIHVGVGYSSDLPAVVQIASAAVQDIPNRLRDRDIEVLFTGFGASSIDLVVRFWSDSSLPGGWMRSQSLAIISIKEHFDAHSIEIPFPIRTLDLPAAALPLAIQPAETETETLAH